MATGRATPVLVGLGLLAGGLAAGGLLNRDAIRTALLVRAIAPDHEFDDAAPPPAPRYDNLRHWAAHPGRPDFADLVPEGAFTDRQTTAAVDVFFIHPTTYLAPDHWNQPLDHDATNTLTDETVMAGQASAFNACCRVYAPRYRQATLYSFLDDGASGPRALDLAYADVVAAFRYFINHFNDDRPFIIAGHSQGSRHADRLLGDEIVGTPLADRMVGAYPVGFGLDAENGVPVCRTPTQTGCQATWNAVGPDPATTLAEPGHICVNPLSWRPDGRPVGFERNLGGVSVGAGGRPEPGVADARCRDGNLVVSEIRSDHYRARPFGRDNYHLYDYALFYLNIRENATTRVDAFLRDRREPGVTAP